MSLLFGGAGLIVTLFSFVACGEGTPAASGPQSPTAPAPAAKTWSVNRRGSIVEIGYGSGTDAPQFAAIHNESGYLRLNPGPGFGWGTSIILPPPFWSGGRYYQGVPIAVTWVNDGADLVVSFAAPVSDLRVDGQLRLRPPDTNSITGVVTINVSGSVELDRRPGEAFKLVMLSSMHVSAAVWDAEAGLVDSQLFAIPRSGWIIQPPISGRVLTLRGGTSSWKTNAPTVEATLTTATGITGWVTESSDPNSDNVGFWAATDQLVRSWQYTVTARP